MLEKLGTDRWADKWGAMPEVPYAKALATRAVVATGTLMSTVWPHRVTPVATRGDLCSVWRCVNRLKGMSNVANFVRLSQHVGDRVSTTPLLATAHWGCMHLVKGYLRQGTPLIRGTT